ncbi:hypothetical protein ACGFJT_42320 [Actinomadura geliboluensis]|uniref:hypothetical protein n=1 Tax=Actinomadura geliboluensis TaxID=882440 RepID=UPI00371E04A8
MTLRDPVNSGDAGGGVHAASDGEPAGAADTGTNSTGNRIGNRTQNSAGNRAGNSAPNSTENRGWNRVAAGARGPGALWGLAQVRAYTGVGKEKARGWWQAARRRAADPAAAAAADALPPPDFLCPEGDGVLGFFAPHGDRKVGDWWTLPRVRPLWRPETIALWALTTGRAVRTGGALSAQYRLPVPMWVDLPPLPGPLPRVLDEIITVTGTSRRFRPGPVHVRLFDGPVLADTDTANAANAAAADAAPVPTRARSTGQAGNKAAPGETPGAARRTVIVLAMPDGGTLVPITWAEEIASHLLATGRLTTEQARRASWFALLPETQPHWDEHHRPVFLPDAFYIGFAIRDAATLADAPGLVRQRHRLTAALERRTADHRAGNALTEPHIQPADLADIDALIGRRLEVYPPGSYTADTVAQFAAHERPVQLPWDPENLATDLEHLRVLHAAVQDLADTAPAGEAASPEASLRGAALRAARDWTAAHAQLHLTGRYLDGTGSGGRGAVHRVMPAPSDADRALVDQVTAHDDEPYRYPMVVRDLLAVRAAHHQAADTGQSPELAAALAHAADRIALHHQTQVGGRAHLQQWVPARVDAPGPGPLPLPGTASGAGAVPDAAAYLATVSWWGPSADDADHAGLLAALFYQHERDAEARHGYDPFGRLVLWCPHAHAFAVAWPTTDRTADLQHPQHRFTALADGRVDLVPLTGPASGEEGLDNADGAATSLWGAR